MSELNGDTLWAIVQKKRQIKSPQKKEARARFADDKFSSVTDIRRLLDFTKQRLDLIKKPIVRDTFEN